MSHFTEYLNLIKSQQLRRTAYIGILIFIATPYAFYYNPGYGLDPSWIYAINMAIHQGLIFGREFIFAYGPLGFLATRLPIYIPAYVYLLFDAYLLLNIIYVLYVIFKRYDSFLVFIFIFLVFVLLQDFRDHDIVMVLSWLMVFMMLHYYKDQKKYALYNAALLATMIAFIKLNMGLIALFIFCFFLVFLFVSKRHNLKFLGYFSIGYGVLFVLVCFLLKVNFIQYTIASLHIINGYNDAMYAELPHPLSNPVFLGAVFLCLVFMGFLVLHFKIIIRDYFYIFICLIILLLEYVLFKQSFVRLHVESYFQYTIPFLGLLFLFSAGTLRRNMRGVLLVSLFVGYLIQGSSSMLFSRQLVKDRAIHLVTYFNQLFSYDEVNFMHPSQQIPESLLSQIKGSVDIMPYEITYLYFNGLDYNPRPVMQSYAAYTEYLDLKNAEKYSESDGPENILLQYHAIDNRYPLFDETKTKLEILKRYEVANNTWDHMLLKRLSKPLETETQRLPEASGKFSVYVKLEDTNELQCLYAHVEYTLLGKLKRLLFQPPQLLISLITEDGSELTYRGIPPILKGGVIINKHISEGNGFEELQQFITFNGEQSKKIVSFKIHTNESWGFKDQYSFYIEKIKFENTTKSAELFHPLSMNIPPLTNNLNVNVEAIKNTDAFAMVTGWVFPYGQNLVDSKTFIVLRSPSDSYVFPTQTVMRKDVTEYFKDSLDASGFKTVIFNNFVKDGEYEVGVLIKNKQGEFFQVTDKHIKLTHEKPPRVERETWIEGGVRYAVESLTENDKAFEIAGWAFAEQEKNDSLIISIILQSPFNLKVFPTEKIERGDVSVYFKRDDLNSSGFKAVIPKEKLPKDAFNIGLLIETSNKKRYVITDKTITAK